MVFLKIMIISFHNSTSFSKVINAVETKGIYPETILIQMCNQIFKSFPFYQLSLSLSDHLVPKKVPKSALNGSMYFKL